MALRSAHIQNPRQHGFRTAEGEPIHEIRIQGNRQISEARIRSALENAPEDIEEAVATLPLPDLNRVILKIEDNDAKRVATIIVLPQPNAGVSPTTPMTRFRTAAGDPIHEIRIRGNKKITEAEILAGLNRGPEDINKAIDALKDALPYFSRVTLAYENDGTRRVAIITVSEKLLSSDYYILTFPPIQFNRVAGWLLAARLELGKRKWLGPVWVRNKPKSAAYQPKIFGEVGYGFGNRLLNYKAGVEANRGQRDKWKLGARVQVHRDTSVVAPDLFPRVEDGLYLLYTVVGLIQLHNYYLRDGVEVTFLWETAGIQAFPQINDARRITRKPAKNHGLASFQLGFNTEGERKSTDISGSTSQRRVQIRFEIREKQNPRLAQYPAC